MNSAILTRSLQSQQIDLFIIKIPPPLNFKLNLIVIFIFLIQAIWPIPGEGEK